MTEAKTKAPAIYPALLKVQAGMASIPKNGHMKFGNTEYDYLRADDVQEKLNPLLTENKIIVKSEYTVDTVMRGRGEGSPYIYVNLALTYISAEDGSEHRVTAVGESAASDDKTVNRALTQAIKNIHRATFQFASGEPEPDNYAPGTPADQAKTSVAKKLDAARANGPAKAPATGDKAEVDRLRSAIKERFLDTGEYTNIQVNALWDTIAKEKGSEKSTVAVVTELGKRLAAGEVG